MKKYTVIYRETIANSQSILVNSHGSTYHYFKIVAWLYKYFWCEKSKPLNVVYSAKIEEIVRVL